MYFVWHLSFNRMPLRFNYVVAASEVHWSLRLFHCVHISYLLSHSPFDGQLGCFCFFAYYGHFYTVLFRVRGQFTALNVETRKGEFSFE